MPLTIDDGLTFTHTTEPGESKLRTVTFAYRPALWTELVPWRQSIGTKSEVSETLKLLKSHVKEWDVLDRAGRPAPIDDKGLSLVSEPVINLILSKIVTWAETDEGDLGNAPAPPSA